MPTEPKDSKRLEASDEARGRREYTQSEIREMNCMPDCFQDSSVVCSTVGPSSGTFGSYKKYPSFYCSNYAGQGLCFDTIGVPSNASTYVSTAEEPEKSDKTIGRYALTSKELEDLRCLPSISDYSDARIIRGRRGFTQDEIRDMNRLPNCFDDCYTRHWVEHGYNNGFPQDGSVLHTTFGPSSDTFGSYKKYPSFCCSNCTAKDHCYGAIRSPSDASTHVSTAEDVDKWEKTIGRYALSSKEIEELNRLPSISAYSDARVIRGQRGYTQDEIRDMQRLPNRFDDSYTRHWVEHGRNNGYSASSFYARRPQSVIGCTFGPSSETYKSYARYPSCAGSDYSDASLGFNSIHAPQGATLNKRMRGSVTIDDISRCPSICSEPYARIACPYRSADSYKEIRAIPDQFKSGSDCGRNSRPSYCAPGTEPFSTNPYARRYRSPSEASLATSADIRHIPDPFGHSSKKSYSNAFGPFPALQKSVCSDYCHRPRTVSDASTQIEYPDIDVSDYGSTPRTQGKWNMTKSEIEDIACLPKIAASKTSIDEPLCRRRSPSVQHHKGDNTKSSTSKYFAPCFSQNGSERAVHLSRKKAESKAKKANGWNEAPWEEGCRKKKNSVHLKPSNEPKKSNSEYMFITK